MTSSDFVSQCIDRLAFIKRALYLDHWSIENNLNALIKLTLDLVLLRQLVKVSDTVELKSENLVASRTTYRGTSQLAGCSIISLFICGNTFQVSLQIGTHHESFQLWNDFFLKWCLDGARDANNVDEPYTNSASRNLSSPHLVVAPNSNVGLQQWGGVL